MRLLSFASIGFLGAIAAELAGCSNNAPEAQTVPTMGRGLRDLSVTESLIHSFGAAGSGDGDNPGAALLNVNDTLYGTTVYGGPSNAGTVFKVSPSGKETILYSFTGGDGLAPTSKLINVNGTLYGTTFDGGTNNSGTVFSITQNGTLSTLYSFGSSTADAQNPYVGLINVNGTLYGTTNYGGTYGDGAIYSVTPTGGHETVLHSFGAGPADGIASQADLINVNGTLYGTTINGGSHDDGTVFSVTTSGSEKVLHSFSGTDGDAPFQGLTNVNGRLFGTTAYGGQNACNCGTVFAMDLSGNEKVLHSFEGSPDGNYPSATLLNLKGTLYGTTDFGGASGDGTVFTITTSGQETVLYTFKGHHYATGLSDGAFPQAAVINVNGALYGTTSAGGVYVGECNSAEGCGSIFRLTP